MGTYLERDLLSAILRDTSREPGALPLLEDALEQLWRARLVNFSKKDAQDACRTLHKKHMSCSIVGPTLKVARS